MKRFCRVATGQRWEWGRRLRLNFALFPPFFFLGSFSFLSLSSSCNEQKRLLLQRGWRSVSAAPAAQALNARPRPTCPAAPARGRSRIQPVSRRRGAGHGRAECQTGHCYAATRLLLSPRCRALSTTAIGKGGQLSFLPCSWCKRAGRPAGQQGCYSICFDLAVRLCLLRLPCLGIPLWRCSAPPLLVLSSFGFGGLIC